MGYFYNESCKELKYKDINHLTDDELELLIIESIDPEETEELTLGIDD